MTRKAYFFDLDGTLLDAKNRTFDWTVSKANIQAIKKLNKEGHLVVFSTGRPWLCFNEIKEQVGCKYTIAANGAKIFDDKYKVVDFIKMDYKQSLKLIDFFRENKVATKINDELRIYGGSFKIKLATSISKFRGAKWNTYKPPKELFKIVGCTSKRKIAKLAKELKPLYPDFEIIPAGHNYLLEITNKTANKGSAALKILKWEKIDPKNAYHFGDTLNDAPAMKVLGTGVSFKNADKEILQFAKYIGPSHKEGGIAKMLSAENWTQWENKNYGKN